MYGICQRDKYQTIWLTKKHLVDNFINRQACYLHKRCIDLTDNMKDKKKKEIKKH